jgi:hypothetical protein
VGAGHPGQSYWPPYWAIVLATLLGHRSASPTSPFISSAFPLIVSSSEHRLWQRPDAKWDGSCRYGMIHGKQSYVQRERTDNFQWLSPASFWDAKLRTSTSPRQVFYIQCENNVQWLLPMSHRYADLGGLKSKCQMRLIASHTWSKLSRPDSM